MGRQLKQQGQAVGDPLLIDSYAHPRTWPWQARLEVRWRRFKCRAGLIAKHPLREGVSYVRLTVTQTKARLRRRGGRANSVSNWLGDQTRFLTPTLRLVHAAAEMALDTYTPRPYPGNILFLRAESADPHFPMRPNRIWAPLVQSMTTYTVKGNHYSMVSDHALSIAARISLCLREARGTRGAALVHSNAGAGLGHRVGEDVA